MSSAATVATSPKKRTNSQRKKSSPTVSDLILKVLSASSERGGLSLAAVKKGLQAGGYDVGKNNTRVLIAIRRLVALKTLVQTRGTGASGSFKLNKKAPALPKKKGVSKRKPKTKRVKRATVKKAAGGDTPAAKKSPRKIKKAKSPRKAKKPSAAKKAKKPKSPMKSMRRVVKSTRTRASSKK